MTSNCFFGNQRKGQVKSNMRGARGALLLLLIAVLGALSSCDAVLVDASTVRVNYYKNLYLGESQPLIECNKWVSYLEDQTTHQTSSCNFSDSASLLSTSSRSNHNCSGSRPGAGGGLGDDGDGPMKPLVSKSTTSVVRSKSRNLSLENGFTIRLENVTVLPNVQQVEQERKIAKDEEGEDHFTIFNFFK